MTKLKAPKKPKLSDLESAIRMRTAAAIGNHTDNIEDIRRDLKRVEKNMKKKARS